MVLMVETLGNVLIRIFDKSDCWVFRAFKSYALAEGKHVRHIVCFMCIFFYKLDIFEPSVCFDVNFVYCIIKRKYFVFC